MPTASRIPVKRSTAAAAVPGVGELVAMPPAKRRRDRVVPSRFRDDSMPPPAKKPLALVVSLPAPGVPFPTFLAPGVQNRDGEAYNVEALMAETKDDSFGPVETAVWRPPPTDADLYRAQPQPADDVDGKGPRSSLCGGGPPSLSPTCLATPMLRSVLHGRGREVRARRLRPLTSGGVILPPALRRRLLAACNALRGPQPPRQG